MKILVTGGAGFVGSHLVDALAEMNNSAELIKAEIIFHQAAMVGVGQSMHRKYKDDNTMGIALSSVSSTGQMK